MKGVTGKELFGYTPLKPKPLFRHLIFKLKLSSLLTVHLPIAKFLNSLLPGHLKQKVKERKASMELLVSLKG